MIRPVSREVHQQSGRRPTRRTSGPPRRTGWRTRRRSAGARRVLASAGAILGVLVVLFAIAYVWSPRRNRARPTIDVELGSVCRKQYESVCAQGWMPHFEEASRLSGIPVETLLAVGSRESN